MKKHFFLLLLMQVIFFSPGAFSDGSGQVSISGEALLYKISQVTRSMNPTNQELERYRAAVKNGNADAEMAALTKEFLASQQHARRLRFKLEELFQFQAESGNNKFAPEYRRKSEDFRYGMLYRGAAQNLFEDMSLKNLSWDQLLTANSYRLPEGICDRDALSEAFKNDCDFFSFLKPATSTADGQLNLSFPQDSEKMAGAITTGRFFSRYANTALNKNRRRAAAVFRIFLCDSMFPAVPDAAADISPTLKLIYPETSDSAGMSEQEIRAAQSDGRHGSDPACAKCHYKLDPLGRVFQTSALYLSPVTSPGRLTYKNAGQKMTDVPVNNFSEMAKAIVQQPEYRSCQVKRLWQWYVGKDISLSDEDRQVLENKFDQLGRKTNDFVAYLISRPEFRYRIVRTADIQVAERAVAIFQRCDSCHNGKESDLNGPIPLFSEFPIGGSVEKMKLWTGLIREQLDLDHDGVGRTMPPSSAFGLSASDIRVIQKWFAVGNPDLAGKRMEK